MDDAVITCEGERVILENSFQHGPEIERVMGKGVFGHDMLFAETTSSAGSIAGSLMNMRGIKGVFEWLSSEDVGEVYRVDAGSRV